MNYNRYQGHETRTAGVFIDVDLNTGNIIRIYFCAKDEQGVEIVAEALQRISKPNSWTRLKQLLRLA